MNMTEPMQWCDWCVADSGRTGAKRPCCTARRVSKLPGYGCFDAIRDVATEYGAEAGELFKRHVLLVTAMRLARAPKQVRLVGYARITSGGGTVADLELLKQLTKQEYERQTA